jgi:hypothetical protein
MQMLQAAEQRVGTSITEQLRWLIRFRDANLTTASDVLSARYGWETLSFARRVGYVPGFPLFSVVTLPERPPPRPELLNLQQGIRTGFTQLFGRDGGQWRPRAQILAIDVIRSPDELISLDDDDPTLRGEHSRSTMKPDSSGNAIAVQFEARWPDAFWFAVAITLHLGSRWLRLCKRCDTFFLATKRQEYCGRRCSQVARTARFRSKPRQSDAAD